MFDFQRTKCSSSFDIQLHWGTGFTQASRFSCGKIKFQTLNKVIGESLPIRCLFYIPFKLFILVMWFWLCCVLYQLSDWRIRKKKCRYVSFTTLDKTRRQLPRQKRSHSQTIRKWCHQIQYLTNSDLLAETSDPFLSLLWQHIQFYIVAY